MEEREEKAIVPVEQAQPMRVAPAITQAHLAAAREHVKNSHELLLIALSATNINDWMDMGGRPYLLDSGCNKMREALGISFTDMKVSTETLTLDGVTSLQCVCSLIGWYQGEPIPEEGTASTNDDFFGWRKINGQRVRLPLSEVDIPSLRKKAITNAKDRVVRASKGLGSLTWDDLAKAGIHRDAVGAITYRKQGAAPGAPAPTPQTGGKVRLRQMLEELSQANDTPVSELLKQYTIFTTKEGKEIYATSIDTMKDTWVAGTLERVRKDWAAIQAPAPRDPGVEG